MDHPAEVRKRYAVAHLQEHLEKLTERVCFLSIPGGSQYFRQRTPLDEFHREVDRALLITPEFVDGNDVGMFELPGNLGLLDEPRPLAGMFGRSRQQPLHRDLAPDVLLDAQNDLAHPALPDCLLLGISP